MTTGSKALWTLMFYLLGSQWATGLVRQVAVRPNEGFSTLRNIQRIVIVLKNENLK